MGSRDVARTFDLRREAYIEFYAAVDAQINNFLDNKGYLRRGRRQKAIDPRNRAFERGARGVGRRSLLWAMALSDACVSRQGGRTGDGIPTSRQPRPGVDADGVDPLGHACSGARTPIM
jgi:hypothetical protein